MSEAAVKVEVTRHFSATPETVFDAWLDAETAALFLFATPSGVMEHVEIVPRIGGGFAIAERRGDALAAHTGTYLAIERPSRLAFDFSAGGPATRVDIEIAASATGCDLTLTHQGVWPDYAERTRAGWSGILDGLARALGSP
jgi:uncharacterized protein YndB with AHSA1/START domain